MAYLNLKIISPKKIVLEKEVDSVTVPAYDGEITILPHHINLISLLNEGIIKIRANNQEEFYAIGGGYLQTDGNEVIVLVSRAYGQDEINEKIINEGKAKAQQLLQTAKDQKEKEEALAQYKRILIQDRLLKKIRKKRPV
jgi:F-type H+-transporting ATPase subunit epsilon